MSWNMQSLNAASGLLSSQLTGSPMHTLQVAPVERCVLIVDDCDYVSLPLEIALSCLEGFRVFRASDVKGASNILFGVKAPIAAVVTDLNMPLFSGYDLIGLLRSSCRHRQTPIIAMSGDDYPAIAERALRSGANAFFAKPFSLTHMRRTLRRLIDNPSILQVT